MTKKVKDIKYPHLEYVSQDVILKIYDKRGKVNFDFHHDPIVEGSAREDFKVTPLKVSPESGNVFELFKLYLPWWLYGDVLHLYDSIIVVYSSLFSSKSVSIIILSLFLSIF